MFTLKKYYPLKAGFFSVWKLCASPRYTQPLRLARDRLLTQPGNQGEGQGDDSQHVALLPGVQQGKRP